MTQKIVLLKTITYRILAVLTTFITGYVVTGDFLMATAIVSVDQVAKMGLYWAHETGWASYLRVKDE